MRDYLKNPCQTNLELYEQMRLSSYYTIQDIQRIHDAYFFTLSKVNGMYRGSGKPFICHLVGTCSILAALGCPIEILESGLMHALYQNRVGFDFETNIGTRRTIITEKFGAQVDRIIAEYTDFELVKIDQVQFESHRRSVILILLADTLEDLVGEALFFRGQPEDDVQVRGSFENYLMHYRTHLNQYILLSNQVGAASLGALFHYWLNEVPYNTYSNAMRKGYYSSFTI
ncbi:MAG: HD domain-containing protein [Chitinophagaceae bacterium]|nr:HD domain-containing protein [Chitinophagaceae bacterium]